MPLSSNDLFSSHAHLYAAYRPGYPDVLFDFILRHVSARDAAWDCATGNGQVARDLARHFSKVYATDISQRQLDQAPAVSNILYAVSPAESTPFSNDSFNLITIAQALHWIDTGRFYDEVRRTARAGALLAAWGYGLLQVDRDIDRIIGDFYHHIVGPYWDPARKLVESAYRDMDFPFDEIGTPPFAIEVSWNLGELCGYLTSWSATQKYIRAKNHDPVPEISDRLRPHWSGDGKKKMLFPVFMRLGKVR